MGSVLQNGTVTPGHIATWTTDGIVQDGGSFITGSRVLGRFSGANFNTTTDQPILMPVTTTVFQLTGIVVTNASISLSAAVGGFYTAAVKGGNQIVASSQAYSSLTGPNLLLNAKLTGFATSARFSSANLPLLPNVGVLVSLGIYLSLTTPQGVPATADIYAIGIDFT
jgi:hypothetical protein